MNSTLMTADALGEVVTLYVGPKRKKCIVHKKILCNASDYFSKAFNGGFREAKEGEMHLPEDDADAVCDLIEYLYRDKIPPIVEHNTTRIRKLYYLAEKICLARLMDRLMDRIKTYHENIEITFKPVIIKDIFANTHEESKLRWYVAAGIAFKMRYRVGDTEWSDEHAELYESCPDLFRDVFKIFTRHGKIAWASKVERARAFNSAFSACDFHTHDRFSEDCKGKKAGKNRY